ncbi:RyR domain-containing protein [Pseudomonas sp.]|uniref:RyR domain-containing protein n=1 Tax=Pseudomonas sp. TaxID=306 RepID=UPI003CC6B14C
MNVLVIARVAHMINLAYCMSIGDDSQPSWEDAPDWQKKSAVAGVEMHLANPNATPEQSHESWLAQKLADGWTYGEVKDAEKKQHPCCLPYDELSIEQKSKDYLFRGVVHALKDLPDADEAVAQALANLPKEAGAALTGAPVGQVGVKYIGRKPTFTDHLYGTGLTFERNQVRYMPTDIGRKFLRHADQFKAAAAVAIPAADEPAADESADDTAELLAKAKAKQELEQKDETALQDVRQQIGLMTKKALTDYAMNNYRQKLDQAQKVDELRRQVIGMVDQYGLV